MIPLTLGTPEQFSALRGFLEQANYTEAAICERIGISSIFEFKGIFENRATGVEVRDTLDGLIHLLMDGAVLSEDRVRALLPPHGVDAMDALGLLGRIEDEPGILYATVFLYPVAGLYVASDRTTPPDVKKPAPHPRDAVYAAITTNTKRFLAAQPPAACEDVLDLCSGTGIAALVAAARYAKHAWACDITARSVHFSEFNCRLNGLSNVSCACGDLYEAIGGRTFDRIVAHPPYIPAERQEWVFRDGGVDGEQILRRVIEGLPDHLRPEGRFYCVTLATDREGEKFEQRIRRWLGEAGPEFDIVLAAEDVRALPDEVRRAEAMLKVRKGHADVLEKLMLELKVTGTFYGTVLIRRKTEPRPAVTARTLKAQQAGAEAAEWLLGFATASAGPDCSALLLAARPRFAPGMKMVVTHTPSEGGLVPSEFALRTSYPFLFDVACGQWVAVAVTWCDGTRTAGEVYRELRQQQVVSEEFSEKEFLGILRLLIANGVLELESFPLPAAAPGVRV